LPIIQESHNNNYLHESHTWQDKTAQKQLFSTHNLKKCRMHWTLVALTASNFHLRRYTKFLTPPASAAQTN